MNNKIQTKGFVVWGVCGLFFLYEFLLRTVVGTCQRELMLDLKLTVFEFSLLSTTIFSLIYGFMQIPVGIIVDNFGLKKSMVAGAILCAISSLSFSYSTSYEVAMLFRAIMGFGASFGFICLLMSVYDWMPSKYNAIFIGLSQFIGTLGPMAAAGPLESLSASHGINWRSIFIYLGIFGFILVFLCFLFVENNENKEGRYIILYRPEKASVAFFRLFRKAQPWYIATLSASLYFTVEYLSENEGRAFLSLKGISSAYAAYMITIAWFGYAIGSPLLGFISDILERRKIILNICAFLLLCSILMILYLSNPILLQFSFFLLGIAASGQSIGLATMSEQFKKQFVAIGFGLNNTIVTLVAGINAPLIGLLLDHVKKDNSASINDYLFVFNILISIAIISIIIGIFFIKETYCKTTAGLSFLKLKNNS